MTEITFYRQKRRDGSVRSGLHATGPYDLENFEKGPEQLADDPCAHVLDWFIDLQLQSPRQMDDAEAARDELLSHADEITAGLNRMVDEIGVGLDSNRPVVWQNFPELPTGYSCRLNCSISLKYRGMPYMDLLRDFVGRWPIYCRSLRVLVEQ